MRRFKSAGTPSASSRYTELLPRTSAPDATYSQPLIIDTSEANDSRVWNEVTVASALA